MAEIRQFHVLGFFVGWVARLLYLGALTVLIPFGAVLLTSGLANLPHALRNVPLSALALVIASAFVLFLHHRSVAHVLAALGWMTLLPGIGGMVFLLVSPENILAFLARIFSGFALVVPLIGAVRQALPNAWLFVIGYILLGLALIHVAGRMERGHALMEHVRKLFGPRARILK